MQVRKEKPKNDKLTYMQCKKTYMKTTPKENPNLICIWKDENQKTQIGALTNKMEEILF